MADIIRAKKSNYFVWALLVLLIIGLAGFGIRSVGGRLTTIGRVGDEEIPIDAFARILTRQMRDLSQRMGAPVGADQIRALGIDRSAIEEVTALAALTNEAKRLGISVSDERLARAITENPAFRGADGAFSKAAYEFVLEQNGLKPAEYEALLRDDLVRGLLQITVTDGIAPPDTAARAILAYLGEKRDVTLVILDESALPEPLPEPDEATLRAWYEAHKDAYRAPEKKRISYIWLSPEMLKDEVTVSEEEIRAAYDARADQFNKPERRVVERLVFKDRASAEKAKAALEAGERSFEDLVRAQGFSMKDVSLGEITRAGLDEKVADAVFAASEGAVVGPIEGPLGPALYRVTAILPRVETPLARVHDKLAEEIALEKARDRISEEMTPIEDLLAAGATLEEVARETPAALGTIDFTGRESEGIAAYNAFREKAIAVTRDDFPEIGELEDGGLFAIRLDEVIPPAPIPFEKVRDRVRADWRKAEVEKRLAPVAEEVRAALEKGGSAATIGRGKVLELTNLARGQPVPDAPPALPERIFALEAPGAVDSLPAEGAVYLVRLDRIIPFDPSTEENRRNMQDAREAIRLRVAQDAFTLFTDAARARAGISLDQRAIDAVISSIR